MHVMGIIFANDASMGDLTAKRTMASLPFGGRYRQIDFHLSNMACAGIRNIGIISRHNYQSLMNHVGDAEEWGLELGEGGLEFLTPYAMSTSDRYRGKLENLFNAMDFLEYGVDDEDDYVVMADSAILSNMDMTKVIEAHIASGKDITVVAKAGIANGEKQLDLAVKLNAKGEIEDKIQGLRCGADDYITKPFEMREVLARIEAVLRRCGCGGNDAPQGEGRRLVFDKLIIDMDAFELIVDGQKVDTPPKEMELLYFLASSPNRVYTRNQLLDEVWGFEYYGDSRTVDVHIKRLRDKIENVSDQWSLMTVWSVGYKFGVK